MAELVNMIMDIFFPRRCPLCNEIVIPKDKKACISCVENLPFIQEPRCKRCSKPVVVQEQEYCYDCEKSVHHYEKGYGVFLYEGTIKKSLMDYKFRGMKQYASFYTEQIIKDIGEKLRRLNCDLLIPVPLHKRKKRIRGFNQAQLLAKGLEQYLNIPVVENVLVRTKYTTPQKKLNDKERLYNLIEAFAVSKDNVSQIIDNKILIVDDIYTTGSTIEACSNVLLKAGARSIYFVTVCIGNGF